MGGNSDIGCGAWAGIGLAWLVVWYWVLSSNYEASTAGLAECGFIESFGSCGNPWREANNSFSLGMLLAIFSIPLPILAWTKLREFSAANQERREKLRENREIEKREKEADRKLLLANQQAQLAKDKIDRSEFVQSLGAATSFLDILPHEDDRSRVIKIRQGISKELGDIVANYSLSQMIALLQSDLALRIKVTCMLEALDDSRIKSSDAEVLRAALAATSK